MTDWTWDSKVEPEDERPARADGTCFYCAQPIGDDHVESCVIVTGRRLDAMPLGHWEPIASYNDGDFVLFWFPNGERGVGGIETAMAFRDDDGVIRTGWTHGGPNSGGDFDFCEPPTMWARLIPPPVV